MCKKVVIIGAGGNAKMIADIIIKSGDIVYGFLDDNKEKGTKILEDIVVIGKISDCLEIKQAENLYFIIGIGNNYLRKEIYEKYNLNYYTAIHPTITRAIDTTIGEGTVIKANATIDASTSIGKNCIIGIGSIITHDNIIGDYVHISPNATLCGTVKIGNFTHIGANATIINNVEITDNCIIGAGAVVVSDIKEKGTYVGVPAKKIK